MKHISLFFTTWQGVLVMASCLLYLFTFFIVLRINHLRKVRTIAGIFEFSDAVALYWPIGSLITLFTATILLGLLSGWFPELLLRPSIETKDLPLAWFLVSLLVILIIPVFFGIFLDSPPRHYKASFYYTGEFRFFFYLLGAEGTIATHWLFKIIASGDTTISLWFFIIADFIGFAVTWHYRNVVRDDFNTVQACCLWHVLFKNHQLIIGESLRHKKWS